MRLVLATVIAAGSASAASMPAAPGAVIAPRRPSGPAASDPRCARAPGLAGLKLSAGLDGSAPEPFQFRTCAVVERLHERPDGRGSESLVYWIYAAKGQWLWIASSRWTRWSNGPAPAETTLLVLADAMGPKRTWEARFPLASLDASRLAGAHEGSITYYDPAGGMSARPASVRVLKR